MFAIAEHVFSARGVRYAVDTLFAKAFIWNVLAISSQMALLLDLFWFTGHNRDSFAL
jgi:hypothetical protein